MMICHFEKKCHLMSFNFFINFPLCKSQTRTVLSSEQLTKHFSKCMHRPRTQLSCSNILNIRSPVRISQILIDKSLDPEAKNSVSF